MNDEDKQKLDYFQKHALPWQFEHMKLRAIGIQVFIPIQGVLLGAWSVSGSCFIPWFGLVSCLSLFLWDERTRFIIGRVHQWGRELADCHFFPLNKDSNPTDGVHVVFGETLRQSGSLVPNPRGLKSHTLAIRILAVAAFVIWLMILLGVGK